MPVRLSVDDIRRRLIVESDGHAGNGDGADSIAELAGLFHTLVAEFFTPGSPVFVTRVLEEVDACPESWKTALVDAAYMEVVAAKLEQLRGTLNRFPGEVASFWMAVENLCEWLTGMLLDVHRRHGSLRAAKDLVECERLLEIELREPGWADSVVMRGSPDAVVRVPGVTSWCLVMLKTGGPSSQADLTLAALYTLLLSKKRPPEQGLRLVSFAPEREERPLSAAELEAATARLKAAVGRMAGVDATRDRPSVVPVHGWKRLTDQHRVMQAELMRVLEDHGVAATIDGPP